jgi:hypothetical protein
MLALMLLAVACWLKGAGNLVCDRGEQNPTGCCRCFSVATATAIHAAARYPASSAAAPLPAAAAAAAPVF